MDSDFKNELYASNYLRSVNLVIIGPSDHPEFTRMHCGSRDREALDYYPFHLQQICIPEPVSYSNFP